MKDFKLDQWTTPDSYWGFNPVGDYGVYVRNRDSQILDNSNFECILAYIKQFIEREKLPEPESRFDEDGDEMPSGWVYTWSASCWAHGWREYLMLRQDAPKELVDYVTQIVDDIRNVYPIFDEDDYSERQDEAIYDFWRTMGTKSRIDYCKDAEISIFAARRENDIPHEVYDSLYESGEFY